MNVLLPGHPARNKLDALQAQIAELQKDHAAVDGAINTEAEGRARLERRLDGAASGRNELRLGVFRARRTDYSLPDDLPPITWSVLIALFGKDVILDRLSPHLEMPGDKRRSLSDAERKELLADLKRKLRAAEEQEERIVCALEADRWTVIRRGNADAAVLLEVWREMSGPENLPDGSGQPARLPMGIAASELFPRASS